MHDHLGGLIHGLAWFVTVLIGMGGAIAGLILWLESKERDGSWPALNKFVAKWRHR